MKTYTLWSLALAIAAIAAAGPVHAQAPEGPIAERAIEAASAGNKYSFIVFYKTADPQANAFARDVEAFANSASDRAVMTLVNISEPQHAALVKRFDVARAPMPMVLALAPNGAVTGAIPRKVSAKQLNELFVTPAMAECMKVMQEGRIALVCIGDGKEVLTSQGAQEFMADPLYKDRVTIVPCAFDDKAEKAFLSELKISSAGESIVFAPPGVLVGTFAPTATYADFTAAMKKAGKCCDDPNCKHAAPQVSSAPSTPAGRK